MTQPIAVSGKVIDMSPRFAQSSAVVGSPATNAITSICAVTFAGFNDLALGLGVQLEGWCSFTVGTSGVTAKLDIRQTGTSGAVIATTGLVTVAATNLVSLAVQGLDTAPLTAGVWIMALTIGSGAATSTVGNVQLTATAI